MTTLTITAKGQVTLKKSLLKHLGVEPGEKVDVTQLPNGRIIIKAIETNATIQDFIGCLAQSDDETPSLTIDQINNIIAQSWAKDNENHS